MELLLAALIASIATMHSAKIAVTDVAYALRGKPSPRGPKSRGAATSYISAVWNDGWTDARTRHVDRRTRRAARDRNSGSFRSFLGTYRDAAWRRWDAAWDKRAERRRARPHRYEPGPVEQIVRGAVVPDDEAPRYEWEDHSSDRTQPCSRCPGTMSPVPGTFHADEGDGGASVDTQCGTCGLRSPRYWALSDGEYEDMFGHAFGDVDRDAGDRPGGETLWLALHPDGHTEPLETPDGQSAAPVTPAKGITEGNRMTTTTGEITGLRTAIIWARDTEKYVDAAIVQTENARAQLEAGDVGSGLTSQFSVAMDQLTTAKGTFKSIGDELQHMLAVAEAYAANPDAGDKQFVTHE
jgi:hypothetical protein